MGGGPQGGGPQGGEGYPANTSATSGHCSVLPPLVQAHPLAGTEPKWDVVLSGIRWGDGILKSATLPPAGMTLHHAWGREGDGQGRTLQNVTPLYGMTSHTIPSVGQGHGVPGNAGIAGVPGTRVATARAAVTAASAVLWAGTHTAARAQAGVTCTRTVSHTQGHGAQVQHTQIQPSPASKNKPAGTLLG